MSGPKRRFTVTIEISGDTWNDVARALQDLLPHIEAHGPACNSVSGGYSSGHWVNVVEDPEMTQEKYHAALDAYLEARRAAKPPPDPSADPANVAQMGVEAVLPPRPSVNCETCGGTGSTVETRYWAIPNRCPDCGGTGLR